MTESLPPLDKDSKDLLERVLIAEVLGCTNQQPEPIAPTKQEFTIEIITELITPVVVMAATQEEAEHLALEQFKLAAGDGQRETSGSLARLWSVIGEGGSQLTTEEKAQIIQLLSISAWTSKSTYSIAEAFERFDEDYQLLDFSGCTISIDDYEDFYAAFNIPLSQKEAWEVIREIAATELASARGGR